MSFNFMAWFQTTEADVVKLIAMVKADIEVAVHDVDAALKWVAGEVPNIVTGLQTAVTLASAVGIVTAPELAAANAAVAALNAFAHAQAAGAASGKSSVETDAQSVVQGYVAYQQAQAAVSAAKATAASAASKPAA